MATSLTDQPPPPEEAPEEVAADTAAVTDPLTRSAATPQEWLRINLFSTPFNSVVTVVLAVFLAWAAYRVLYFVLVTGRWEIIRVNLASFMVGNFPRGELLRAAGGIALVSAASGLAVARSAASRTRADQIAMARIALPLVVFVALVLSLTQTSGPVLVLLASIAAFAVGRQIGVMLPHRAQRLLPVAAVVTLILAYGAVAWFGGVGWNSWGGLMLNLFLALAAITLSFPFGVLLALGRRSSFPAVRLICVGYIELIRGVPLITLLLMGQTMLGFFLPTGMSRPGVVTRALVALVLFTAAYVAEDVRGGLQSVPKGQTEAATALGLSPIKTTFLIVLPQALRNIIPALVGQFISLTKDTALVSIVGLLEILRVARAVTQQPQFQGQGLNTETLLFAALAFWAICFTMSRASQRLERRLGVGIR